MCGIHGIVGIEDPAPVDHRVLVAMGRAAQHRGPDDHGAHCDGAVGIGMRRLSIIDVGGGHQPLCNEDGTQWLVCNGEIYNFRELRESLLERGHRFRTGSDSEVILHLYEEYGDRCVEHLRGMFGFALWDSARRRLLIARDRLGVKPLYYARHRGRLLFASEIKSLLAVPGFDAALNTDAVPDYLHLGYSPAPDTLFAGVHKLPPGSTLVMEHGALRVQRYWSLPEQANSVLDADEWCGRLRQALEESVTAQMVSDVPLGAFLSGGIDSSAVVAMMARQGGAPVRTYSIGFAADSGGAFYNELPYAKQVADLFGTEHKEIIVRPNVASLLPRLIWHLDEPMADAAFVTTYLVSEFAARDVKVILSGVGGDELFGGYRRYLGDHYGAMYQKLPAWLRRNLVTPLARRLPSDRHSPLLNLSRYARSFVLSSELPFEERYRSYVQAFDRETCRALLGDDGVGRRDALRDAFDRVPAGDPLYRLMRVDLDTQLPDDLLMLTDKMSMACSLECRVPLLDERMVELAASMPSSMKIRGGKLKYVLKRALKDDLPDSILHRKKRGFGAPMGAWLKRELATVMTSVLSRDAVEKRGVLAWKPIETAIADHTASRADHTDHLLALMNFELWCRIYLDGTDAGELGERIKGRAAA